MPTYIDSLHHVFLVYYMAAVLHTCLSLHVDSMLTLYQLSLLCQPIVSYIMYLPLYANLILMLSFAYTYEVIASYVYVHYSIQCH